MIDTDRKLTRRQRYNNKMRVATRFPMSMATVNFMHEVNVAYATRALACYGGDTLHVIGAVPEYNILRRESAGNCDLIRIRQHRTPGEFVRWCKDNNNYIISLELTDNSQSILSTKFPDKQHVVFVVGHETSGVPVEILHQSDAVCYIPMVGAGYCVNTSQAANVAAYEYMRRRVG